jgi:hypothetical protein
MNNEDRTTPREGWGLIYKLPVNYYSPTLLPSKSPIPVQSRSERLVVSHQASLLVVVCQQEPTLHRQVQIVDRSHNSNRRSVLEVRSTFRLRSLFPVNSRFSCLSFICTSRVRGCSTTFNLAPLPFNLSTVPFLGSIFRYPGGSDDSEVN